MLQPKRAPVRPRVLFPQSAETLLLEDEIARWLDQGASGAIVIQGGPGAGKTTALRHLQAALGHAPLAFLDQPPLSVLNHEMLDREGTGLFIFTVSEFPHALSPWFLTSYTLAPWSDDDLIEYLLNEHHDRCGKVMGRLTQEDRRLLEGNPELYCLALDLLATDDSLANAQVALSGFVERHLGDTDLRERSWSACLNALTVSTGKATTLDTRALTGFPSDLTCVLRHPAIQLLLSSQRIAADLHGDSACDYLALRLCRELIHAVTERIREDTRAIDHLHRLLDAPPWSHAMAATLLHRTVRGWSPPPQCLALTGAYLEGAQWPGIRLADANLVDTDFFGADLCGADLTGAEASGSNLALAQLRGAKLDGISAIAANLSYADLTSVQAHLANFAGANLHHARLIEGSFRSASFEGAILRHASLVHCVLEKADFSQAVLDDTDFTGVNLREANLSGLVLAMAHFAGADFTRAQLMECDFEVSDLEGMIITDACFAEARLDGALLTGSIMPGANFRNAFLRGAYLAGVEWEGADLRGADLRGSTFHLGSSRSGLVGVPIASEGSRTGFYTDDYEEQYFKAPEEIRKANLCRADLRGALVDDVDFYLVDLRGATYDEIQGRHFRRCRAILEGHAV